MALRGYDFAKGLGFPSADFESFRFRLGVCIPMSGTLNCESIARVFGIQRFHAADSLPATWAFFLQNPYHIRTLYDVVNAGGDTDSNGAMVGALLGALNGMSIFPQCLIDGLWQKERIVDPQISSVMFSVSSKKLVRFIPSYMYVRDFLFSP